LDALSANLLTLKPFHAGFNVSGYQLGLNPDASTLAGGTGGSIAYWGVSDADAAATRLLSLGATAHTAVQEVGGGIKVATVRDPFGNIFGIIENPHFRLPSGIVP
jgi:predicted enzyme related to lactoylglutathione lyase